MLALCMLALAAGHSSDGREQVEDDEDPGDNWRAGSTKRADRGLVPREVRPHPSYPALSWCLPKIPAL